MRTSGWSPAVSIAAEPKLIWKAETPNVVPCGARISAGKSGKVARSLPASAVESVNCPPVSCIPSLLSPAKRTTTASTGGCAAASFSVIRWVAVATSEVLTETRVASCDPLRPVGLGSPPFRRHGGGGFPPLAFGGTIAFGGQSDDPSPADREPSCPELDRDRDRLRDRRARRVPGHPGFEL